MIEHSHRYKRHHELHKSAAETTSLALSGVVREISIQENSARGEGGGLR